MSDPRLNMAKRLETIASMDRPAREYAITLRQAAALLASEPEGEIERIRARCEAYRQAYLAERRDVQQRIDLAVEDALDGCEPEGREPDVYRCFHCDEVFDAEGAAEHFGPHEMAEPACAIDVAKYREMEETVARYRHEDTDLHRAIHRLHADLHTKVQRAEEQGYDKGLQDGLALAGTPSDSPAGERCIGCGGPVDHITWRDCHASDSPKQEVRPKKSGHDETCPMVHMYGSCTCGYIQQPCVECGGRAGHSDTCNRK